MNRRALPMVMTLLALTMPALGATGSKSVPSPMGGNGHNVTFDGRLFLVTTSTGWQARVFRPESMGYDAGGFPDVGGAFSAEYLVNGAPSGENANALCESDADHTPYRCDGAGNAAAGGAFDCYDLTVLDSDASHPNATMRRRSLKVWVANPGTAAASVANVVEGAKEPLTPTLYGIEPTVSRDGKLFVYQGHPDNDGKIDILMYSRNANACAASGWSAPKSISSMNADAAVAGYRLSEKPLRAADGSVFAPGELFHGAYPWLFPDGEALIFSAVPMPCVSDNVPGGCGPRRNGTSVVGYPTNWGIANIDGGINPSRVDQVRLFFSSPGPATFSQIPRTPGHDVWPFFGSNTSNYTEVVFDDSLDGRYAGVWNMNEVVQKNGEFDLARTGDTGGYFNTARLLGGASIAESNDAPGGRSVHLDGVSGRLRVQSSPTLSPLYALTVEMTLRPDAEPNCDGHNNWRLLLAKGETYSIVLEEDGQLHARVRAGGVTREVWSQQPIPLGAWSKVALTYLANTGEIAFFVNGVETARVAGDPALLDPNTSDLLLGAPGASAVCPDGNGAFAGAIDDVRISNIVRYPDEVQGGPLPTPTPSGTSTPAGTPTATPTATPGGHGADGASRGCSTTGAGGSGDAAFFVIAALGLLVADRRARGSSRS